ncbi:hypothetical protein DFH27DRAFT_616819 [Peziza echinospora]|nr:hypothetical protein DFH27DRAFT_616819 [Peziza echinospora]
MSVHRPQHSRHIGHKLGRGQASEALVALRVYDLAHKEASAAVWNRAIQEKEQEGWTIFFTDGSMLPATRPHHPESRTIPGWGAVTETQEICTGWGVAEGARGEGNGHKGNIGTQASVHDGEIAANAHAMEIDISHCSDLRLVISDSLVAIQNTINLSRGDKPRSMWERRIATKLAKGEENVALAWCKSHIGIKGNEAADARAKAGAKEPWEQHITCSGTRTILHKMRKAYRGTWSTYMWNQNALTKLTKCYTDRGPFTSWGIRTRRWDPGEGGCRKCGEEELNGEHVALQCKGRPGQDRPATWEEAAKAPTFFEKLDLRSSKDFFEKESRT